jgi:diguanylate cyclase (GGDEF)-like protein
MMHALRTLDRHLDRLARPAILALAAGGVCIVGGVDYLTGYEVSMSLLYLGPVALAAWYSGARAGIAMAVLSCIGWYVADLAAGNRYSHPAIPVWNALIRLGFFVVTGLLLDALRRSLRAQQHLARTDALTGLGGRRAFEERLEHDLALAQRRASTLSLAYLDLDGFKAVNDSYGHAEGDRLLSAVGRLLNGAVREADTAARLGGDEFALVLPDTDERGARQVVDKLSRELGEVLAAHPGGVGCSIGVVTLLDAATPPQRALAAADALMYEVKRKGKGAVAFTVLGGPASGRAAPNAPQATRR